MLNILLSNTDEYVWYIKDTICLKITAIQEIFNNTGQLAYLYELSVCFIHLAENAGGIPHKFLYCIHVIEGHKKNIFRTRA